MVRPLFDGFPKIDPLKITPQVMAKIDLTMERCSTCLQLFCNFTPGGKDDGVINAGINMMDKEQDVWKPQPEELEQHFFAIFWLPLLPKNDY